MKFDLSKVEFSEYDLKRKISIPKEPTKDLAYLIGLHIGDGSMNFYNGKGLYSVRGHKIDDKRHYIEVIKPLFKRVYNVDFNLREFPDVFGFQFSSVAVLTFENRVLGLPLGPKGEISIPDIFLHDDKLSRAVIRGIFDTDGCVYLENKKTGVYPRLELSSISQKLIFQVKNVLDDNNINSFVWCQIHNQQNWSPLFCLRVSGHSGLFKWNEAIGMDNPKHINKIRNMSAQERI